MNQDLVPAAESTMELTPVSPDQVVSAIRQRVEVVERAQRELMRPDVHFGVVPGTKDPSLWQPGAEVLCLAFNLAAEFDTADLSAAGEYTYRVRCRLVDRNTGLVVGSAQAEATTKEDRWGWRRAASDAEYEATPADRRRIKYGSKRGGGSYEVKQVRQDPDTVRDTVLAQAEKRAFVRATKRTVGASHLFKESSEDASAGRIGPMALQLLSDLMERKGLSEAGARARLSRKGFDGELRDMHFLLWEQFCAWLYKQPDTDDAAAETASDVNDVEADEVADGEADIEDVEFGEPEWMKEESAAPEATEGQGSLD